jgi:eukaryotic-like serine/threonine-protein kinase
MVGQTVSHYRILEKLGGGGMGVVYKAEDTKLGRLVALKFLSEPLAGDSAALERFRREARAASVLDHPNICTIYEIGEHAGLPFIAMQYLEGQPLDQHISGKPLSLNEVAEMGIQIAGALGVAHAAGIIHRDIKPANIFITQRGQVKILDFGVAKLSHELRTGACGVAGRPPTTVDAVFTSPGAQVGTFAYMSPEQERGEELDARSDLFSFGLVLYDMATGWNSFSDKVAAVVHDALGSATAKRSGPRLPPELGTIIEKATQVDRKLRYQNAADIRADLQRLKRDSEWSREFITAGEARLKPARKSIRWEAVAGATLLVIGLAVGGWLLFFHKAHALTDKDTIVLADFTNRTGDTVFDGTLRQGLSVQLEQSPFLSVISDQQIQQTLQMMGQKPDAKLTPEIARELCQRTGSAAVLDGSIIQIGTPYLLTVQAINCSTGESLASTETQASDKSHVLDALGKAALEMRNKLGESLSTVQKFDTPLKQATTSSLEALKAFSSGGQVANTAGSAAAIPFFKHAIELDPNFAMAYVALGTDYWNLNEPSLASENMRKAFELRGQVSEYEKLAIEAEYHFDTTGDLEKARQACELWAQTYPRDESARNELGIIYAGLGQYDKALAELREVLRLYPERGRAYSNVAITYIRLNHLREALATLEKAKEKNLDYPSLHDRRYLLAFLENDAVGMAKQVAWAEGKPGVEDLFLGYEADTAGYFGQLANSRAFSSRAVASAEHAGEREAAASYEADEALREALFANATNARQRAASASGLSKSRDVQYVVAMALALAGDWVRAQSLADDLDERFPGDSIVQFKYLPTLHAQVALSRNDASKAIEGLQAATPYELGDAGAGSLYPSYVRGKAYLATHQGNQAAAEFQKILDHRGIVVNEPIGVLAHLGLARAYMLQADTAKAKAAYQDFLTLWKDADPDIPILKQAKAEYAKLQ